MSQSVGLMVRLSLSDRSMRRLLDAIVQLPHRPVNYVLLKQPRRQQPSNAELDQIHEKAIQYKERFERSGIKRGGVKGSEWRQQIRAILREVERLDVDQQTFVFSQLGIRAIWYDEHDDIPRLINQIL